MNAFNKEKILHNDTSTPTQFNRTLIEGGIEYGDDKLELYETNSTTTSFISYTEIIHRDGLHFKTIVLQNIRKQQLVIMNFQ